MINDEIVLLFHLFDIHNLGQVVKSDEGQQLQEELMCISRQSRCNKGQMSHNLKRVNEKPSRDHGTLENGEEERYDNSSNDHR